MHYRVGSGPGSLYAPNAINRNIVDAILRAQEIPDQLRQLVG